MRLVWLVLCLAAIDESYAATYWVSPTGAAAWGSCVGSTPLSGTAACAPTTALANAVAGDTVNFRSGTYTVPQHTTGTTYNGTWNVSNAGTGDADANRIIFQAYTGETVTLDGTSGGAGDDFPLHCFTVMLGIDHDYVTWQGMTFTANGGAWMPRVMLGHQGAGGNPTGIKFIYNTMNGGPNCEEDDNNEGVRIEQTINTYVGYNTFYNYRSATIDEGRTTATKAYSNDHLSQEHNEIYDGNVGIYLKHNTTTGSIAYNWFHNVRMGIEINTNTGGQSDITIQHNLIQDCGKSGIKVWQEASDIPRMIVKHNTIYCPTASSPSGYHYGAFDFAVSCCDNSGAQVKDNIFIAPNGNDHPGAVFFATSGIGATSIDYNNYGGTMNVACGGTDYTTLTGLRAATCWGLASPNHDQNSIATDPTFVNGSGRLSQLTDFTLTAASAGYHAASDSTDMGANISLVGTGASAATGGSTTPSTSVAFGRIMRLFEWVVLMFEWTVFAGGMAWMAHFSVRVKRVADMTTHTLRQVDYRGAFHRLTESRTTHEDTEIALMTTGDPVSKMRRA